MGNSGPGAGSGPGDHRPDATMQHNADFAKDFARHHRDYDETVEQMNKLLHFRRLRPDNASGARHDGRVIDIDGVEYHLTQFINKGGFGQIFRAQDRKHNRLVAMKIMNNTPSIQEEIKNEINFLRLTKSIALDNHPVIEYFGCKFTKDTIFIAMELAATDLLTFWFSGAVPRDAEQRFMLGIIIIVYVLRALIFLEKLNIIHGDIKPQNLVVVQSQQHLFVKLIDFGTVEKMNTRSAQITVDAGKAHTVYFASPEFLRRNGRNLVSRHLHKKSDAWAAGVMFYVLFFERFPWKDEFEYDNFCNNPRARDIVVPRDGGYKAIIELLLKKNPEERTSAKSTYLQMKEHPALKIIIQVFQDKFCSVDDVCRMRVTDEVRQALARLPRSGHTVHESGGSRRACRYGTACFNSDLDHRQEFVHPGDPDYHAGGLSANGHFEKLKCRYGTDCYRLDSEHRRKYLHPASPDRGPSAKKTCRYGRGCRDNSLDHLRQFSHPDDPNKDRCRYGNACNKMSDHEHMMRYGH